MALYFPSIYTDVVPDNDSASTPSTPESTTPTMSSNTKHATGSSHTADLIYQSESHDPSARIMSYKVSTPPTSTDPNNKSKGIITSSSPVSFGTGGMANGLSKSELQTLLKNMEIAYAAFEQKNYMRAYKIANDVLGSYDGKEVPLAQMVAAHVISASCVKGHQAISGFVKATHVAGHYMAEDDLQEFSKLMRTNIDRVDKEMREAGGEGMLLRMG